MHTFLLTAFIFLTAKHHHKTRKQQVCSSQLPEIPGPGRNPDPAQNNTEENRKDAEINKAVIPTATILDSAQTDQGLSVQLNESLRWDGILEDPVAEEERLRIYKMNRRKRYELYLQQHFPTEPCPAARHSPWLHCRALCSSSHHILCKEGCCSCFPEEQAWTGSWTLKELQPAVTQKPLTTFCSLAQITHWFISVEKRSFVF